jgi:hypothetical protein
MFGVILLIFAISAFLSWIWSRGIDNMKKNHPNYEGEDFLDWGLDDEDKNSIL